MKVYLIFLLVISSFATSSAQGKKIYMWFSGDQEKPMPEILLAVDSCSMKNDTDARIAVDRKNIPSKNPGEIK